MTRRGGWRGRGGQGHGARLRRLAGQVEAIERDLRDLSRAPAETDPVARAAQARIEAALAAALVEARGLSRRAGPDLDRAASEGRADEDWRATASRDAPLINPSSRAPADDDEPWSEH